MTTPSYPVRDIGTIKVITIPVSFESGEDGTLDLPPLGYRFLINRVDAGVTKALAGTDAASITLGNGATVLSTLSLPLSSALNAQATDQAPTQTAFATTDKIRLITAKTTAGGKALVTIQLQVLPSH